MEPSRGRPHAAQKGNNSAAISRRDRTANQSIRMIAPLATAAIRPARSASGAKVNGVWKVVDVYFNGVSQLILHRTEFAEAIASGGPPAMALIAHLNNVSDGLMKQPRLPGDRVHFPR